MRTDECTEPNLYELIEQLMIEKQELLDMVKSLRHENRLLKKELERKNQQENNA